MKPQPMSDAEIEAILPDPLAFHSLGRVVSFVRAVIEERDAQWAAMIGEPVAWALAGSGHSSMQGPALWLRAPTADEQAMWASFGHPATVSPLYAIKEMP